MGYTTITRRRTIAVGMDCDEPRNCSEFEAKLPDKESSLKMTNEDYYNLAFDSTSDALLSTQLKKIAYVIRNGGVATSTSEAVLRSSCKFWKNEMCRLKYWAENLRPDKKSSEGFKQGTFNYVVFQDPTTEIYNVYKNEYPTFWEGKGKNSGKIVIRVNNGDGVLTEDSVLKEMYTTGYASCCNIGPQLLASYYVLRPSSNSSVKAEAGLNRVTKTFSASVAWDGDCHSLIDKNFRNTNFCTKFGKVMVALIMKAASVGFFHADIKPPNILFRVDKGDLDWETLELCFTDFDTTFCTILTPNEREGSTSCLAVAMVCMFLGMIRCAYSEDHWRALVGQMRSSIMSALINFKTEEGVCDFLQNTLAIEEWHVDNEYVEAQLKYDEAKAAHNKDRSADKYKDMKTKYDIAMELKKKVDKLSDGIDKTLKDLGNSIYKDEKGNAYSGQKMAASKSWQTHVGNYLTNRNFFKQNWIEKIPGQNKTCMKIERSSNLYKIVYDFALGSVDDNSHANSTSTKRKIVNSPSFAPGSDPVLECYETYLD